MKAVLLVLLVPFLVQCSSSSSSKPLANLSSPARAQAWGSPKTTQTAGGYRKTYTNPSNSKESLTITGTSKLLPFFVYPPHIKSPQGDIPQKWKTSLVMGKTMQWYQSSVPTSTRGSIFRSMGLTLSNQSGASGQFQIEAQGSKNQVRTWISELRLGQ